MAKRDSFLFRLPPEMLDALRKWAEDDLRSANSQLELILQHALKSAGRLPKSQQASRTPDANDASAESKNPASGD